MKRYLYILLFVASIVVQGCYQELEINSKNTEDIFDFYMSESNYKKVTTSKGERYEISPAPTMEFKGKAYLLDNMKVRGQTTSSFVKKSFSVNPTGKLNLKDSTMVDPNVFKLISLVFDYTYIENTLSHRLLNEINLWSLNTFFTQVRINDLHQGLYMYIEDPERFLFREKNAEFVFRRYYQNRVKDGEANPNISTESDEAYISVFNSWYSLIKKEEGEILYNKLSETLNLKNYMRKMAIDLIIKNGDYTDEVSFYATHKDGTIYFDILPWDYDDIFASKPHEINVSWSMGTLFGDRFYATYEEQIKAKKSRLVFSIEDDLDYKITMDDYLYQKYLDELAYVLSILPEKKISSIFDDIRYELTPFYLIDEVIEQSKNDKTPTSSAKFKSNIEEKKLYLINRIAQLSDQLTAEREKFNN